MSDPRVMPEMVKAALAVFQAHGFVDRDETLARMAAEIYLAMEAARPPGYTSKVLRAMQSEFEAQSP